MTTNMTVARMLGRTEERKRAENDFYPTPVEATEALLRWLPHHWKQPVWEPACGDGAISRQLSARGMTVNSTDLIDRGYGEGGVDFLKMRSTVCNSIITNPPFNLAEAFIRKTKDLGIQYVAMLLKAHYWHAKKRLPLFQEWPPAYVLPLTWRLDFLGMGSPPMDMSWHVWLPEHRFTTYRPLSKPILTDVFA